MFLRKTRRALVTLAVAVCLLNNLKSIHLRNASLNTSEAMQFFVNDNSSSKHNYREPLPVGHGMASCMVVMDDTMRLSEFIAYHYTVAPLQRFIVGVDPKTSPNKLLKLRTLAAEWNEMPDITVILWENDTYIPENRREQFRDESSVKLHDQRQKYLVQKCAADHARHNMTWTQFSDSDEFLIFNTIHPDEIAEAPYILLGNPHNTKAHDFSGTSPEVRDKKKKSPADLILADRRAVVPLRANMPSIGVGGMTIMEWLQQHEQDLERVLDHPKCIRTVGHWFGAIESTTPLDTGLNEETKRAIERPQDIMTLRYRRHTLQRKSDFTKTLINVSARANPDDLLQTFNSIHNPDINLCGRNGQWASGNDYPSALFRLHHYNGSPESYKERSNDPNRGDDVDKRFRERNDARGPYIPEDDPTDDDIRPWANAFVQKVGVEKAKQLLRFTKPATATATEVKNGTHTVN